MGKQEKLLAKILRGTSDINIPFSGICHLLRKFGFDERTRGDHHIFTMDGIEEILNLQPKRAKRKKMRNKYEIIVYWRDEDNAFIAEVPELPGCMADGATYQEAISNAEVIIQEWIETAEKLGRAIPQPKGRLIYA